MALQDSRNSVDLISACRANGCQALWDTAKLTFPQGVQKLAHLLCHGTRLSEHSLLRADCHIFLHHRPLPPTYPLWTISSGVEGFGQTAPGKEERVSWRATEAQTGKGWQLTMLWKSISRSISVWDYLMGPQAMLTDIITQVLTRPWNCGTCGMHQVIRAPPSKMWVKWVKIGCVIPAFSLGQRLVWAENPTCLMWFKPITFQLTCQC